MREKYKTLSHDPLVWQNKLLPGFSGVLLPGSKVLSAQGSFGAICIQEFKTQHYTISYNWLQTFQPFVLALHPIEKGLFTQLVLRGHVDCYRKGHPYSSLKKDEFILFKPPPGGIVARFQNNIIYQSFEASYSQPLVSTLFTNYPTLRKYFNRAKGNILPLPAGVDILEQAHSILRCTFEKDLRRFFFDNRVPEILFRYLVRIGIYEPVVREPSPEELEAIQQAQLIITADITNHFSIPELSRRVSLNEFRLKQLFKQIHGIGPYEFLVRLRMQKAVELLQSGLSVKEAAAMTGYRPSDFTYAFIQYYGFAPSSIKKKNS